MSLPESHEVTEFLVAWSGGDEQALERLASLTLLSTESDIWLLNLE